MDVLYRRDGVLLLDKPSGMTSFDVIRILRKKLKIKKCGHAGTLDKFASGLLIICLGWTTKLVPYFMGLQKRYIATIQLGVTTDTLDNEGVIVSQTQIRCSLSEIKSCINDHFIGNIVQVPPEYSAVKIGGKRSSDRVRRGEAVAIAPREVVIYAVDVIDFNQHHGRVTLDITCSKGTYIRALARDIGIKLNTGAHVVSLRRLSIGNFGVDDAVTMEQCEELSLADLTQNRAFLLPYEALSGLGTIAVLRERIAKIKYGKPLAFDDVVYEEEGDEYRVVPEGTHTLVGIARKFEQGYRCRKVFIEELNKIDTL